MSNTKYVHCRTGVQGTIALEVPTKDYLSDLFNTHSNKAYLKVGVVKLHPKEQFVKSIGRERSSERMKYEVATLTDVRMDGTRHVFHFTFESELLGVDGYTLCFGTTAESANVHLLSGVIHGCDY